MESDGALGLRSAVKCLVSRSERPPDSRWSAAEALQGSRHIGWVRRSVVAMSVPLALVEAYQPYYLVNLYRLNIRNCPRRHTAQSSVARPLQKGCFLLHLATKYSDVSNMTTLTTTKNANETQQEGRVFTYEKTGLGAVA